MAFDNTNRGSIWKNDKKDKDTHPDFTGTINVDGKDYWLNGWRRKEGAAEKSPAMTFTVRPKESRDRNPNAGREHTTSATQPMDDEIPF